MNVLVHYTTQHYVFNLFSKAGTHDFTATERIKYVSDFYNKYHRSQSRLFFIVSYFDTDNKVASYTICNISFDERSKSFKYCTTPENTKKLICDELGLKASNTYDNESFYRVFTIQGDEREFVNRNNESDLNKIKMKFFTWDELLASNEILFNEINDKIFNKENVLKIASTYSPKIKYTDKQKEQKYYDALKSIGFISKTGINTSNNTLHGDIGEFLMHIMLSQFLSEQSNEKYIYPKLVFKTSPNMPVYGNDGTIYLKDKKEIYYLEAKFYSDLKSAIDKAVESLTSHNEVSQEVLNHKIELFRNIKTDELSEIVEIDEEVKENLVLFLICDDFTEYDEISKIVKENTKLNNLKTNFNIVLFVLPILNKQEYLNFFCAKSNAVWEKLDAN